MTMHANSIAAHRTLKPDERKAAILRTLEEFGVPMTDRAIAADLGFSDPNATRPRITEMVESGVLEEAYDVTCSITGKQVRAVRPGNGAPRKRGPSLTDELIEYFRISERAREVAMFPDADQAKQAEKINRLI